MKGPTATVTVTLVGVRREHVDRLKTVVKGQLTRFANKVDVSIEEAEAKPKKGK